MATTTSPIALGKYDRLFVIGSNAVLVGQALLPVDSLFVMVNNENDVELSWKSDKDSVNTKTAGKITLPEGDDSWTIKVTTEAVLTDLGFPKLVATLNDFAYFQIRDTKNNKVMIEGKFTATDMSVKSQEKGVRQVSFTLENSDVITLNLATGGRDVVTGS